MHLFTIHASILDTKFRPLAQYYAWISGVGEQAYKSSNGAIFVKVGQIKFMSEAFWPVKDGVVGPEVTAAISADGGEGASLAVYETSFRLAKLFAAKLQ